ncbi:MAG: hypothetical protein AVO39_09960 [delta proteobacterium MLS_D]|jgi:twitching motility protein PilT|nr:MAG: hypothetical protein AVO39_09960 [delta proteobacterium MLS_D]
MNRFQKIITDAVRDSVSDIHITGGHPVVTRRNGEIRFHRDVQPTHREIDDIALKLLTPRHLEELRRNKSIDVSVNMSNARLRVNVFTTLRGISMAIRLLPGSVPTIETLNLHPSIRETATYPSGLVLICGATGTGKTSTVASIINEINTTREAHVITIENPIEYALRSERSFIQQRELGTHVPSFSQGLLDVLRENPDVIVVGELREPDTMRLTLNAAESGHLLIATMHAASAEEAIYRLCNAVPPEYQHEIRYQLSLTIKMIIVQQLVYFRKFGFRVPILSIVKGTSSMRNLIRENKLNQIGAVTEMGRGEGMYTMERYRTEYLTSRKYFVPFSQSFFVAKEGRAKYDNIYQSPLTQDEAITNPDPPAGETARAAVTDAIPRSRVRDESDASDVTTVTIGEEMPLQEAIEKLGNE